VGLIIFFHITAHCLQINSTKVQGGFILLPRTAGSFGPFEPLIVFLLDREHILSENFQLPYLIKAQDDHIGLIRQWGIKFHLKAIQFRPLFGCFNSFVHLSTFGDPFFRDILDFELLHHTSEDGATGIEDVNRTVHQHGPETCLIGNVNQTQIITIISIDDVFNLFVVCLVNVKWNVVFFLRYIGAAESGKLNPALDHSGLEFNHFGRLFLVILFILLSFIPRFVLKHCSML